MTWKQILRDFLRGFTDADLESLSAKLDAGPRRPGDLISVTPSELAAIGEYFRRRQVVTVIDH